MPDQALTALSGATTLDTPIAVLLSLALSFGIAWIYKKTHHGLSYSQSFVFTLILLSVLASVAMLVIGGSLAAAFTLLGAFTIIRFRTAVKETRDTAFIFWSLITGMAVGLGAYGLAIIEAVMISGIIFLLSKYRFGSLRNYEHVLTFSVPATEERTDEMYKALFKKHLAMFAFLNASSREEGRRMELTYNVKFLNDANADSFMKELMATPGIQHANLFVAKDDIEY